MVIWSESTEQIEAPTRFIVWRTCLIPHFSLLVRATLLSDRNESEVKGATVNKVDEMPSFVVSSPQQTIKLLTPTSCGADIHLPFRHLLIHHLLMEKPAAGLFVDWVRLVIHLRWRTASQASQR